MKKTIFGFMKQHMKQVAEIIAELSSTFNAHEFIQKFEKRFQVEYAAYLNSYTVNPPMKVNNQIARFLSANETAFKITKTRRVTSLNANGKKSSVQEWKK